MKFYYIALLALFLVSASSISNLSASSGAKDSNGCHDNNGTYLHHCHVAGEIAPKFVRKDYKYRRPSRNDNTGYYSEISGCIIEYDHVVALKDAHISGAWKMSKSQKKVFANDSNNLVPSCRSVNRSKSHLAPYDFYRRSTDGKGVEVKWRIQKWCHYVKRYYDIKKSYNLSFANNRKFHFKLCGIVN